MIKNKAESDREIERRDLNRMFEGVFSGHDTESLIKFMSDDKFKYYNIRDKSKPMGRFVYKVTSQEVIDISKEYTKYAVYESLADADSNMILQGDMKIDSDFILTASLSDIKNISNREAMTKPVYNINVDLKEEQEPDIKGLSDIIDYVINNELIDMVVEFSLFGVPVGIKHENIIIWELRNY